MKSIPLTSAQYRVVAKKRTTAQMFKDTEVGDVIVFTIDMQHTGYASRGTYATSVTATNVTKGLCTHKSQSDMMNIINRSFVLQRVDA